MGLLTRRRLLIAAAVVAALAVAGTLAGVLTKAAVDRRDKQQQQDQQDQVQEDQSPAATAAPTGDRGATVAGGSSGTTDVRVLTAGTGEAAAAGNNDAAAPDDRAPYYTENQRLLEESIYLPLPREALLVAAQDGGGALPFPYADPTGGPCRSLSIVSNASLDLSAAATGCRGAQCAISMRVTLPAPGSCAAIPGPFPTVYVVSGFSCVPGYYKTLVERLATWGYAVIQYDRPLGGVFQPSSETETAYFDAVMAWRNAQNNTAQGRLSGQFSTAAVGVVGHSMGGGLAAILSGIHPRLIGAAVLLDPVNYTQLSLQVARQFLVEYGQPVLVMTVGVHCLDLNGCVPPQDHQPTAAEDAEWMAAGACKPNWSCCNWDDNRPGLEVKLPTALAYATDGPSGFVEFAPSGSWLAHLPKAGHTSLLEPGSSVFNGRQCPAAAPPAEVQPDVMALSTAFLEARLRGQVGTEQHALAWADSVPPERLTLSIKPAAAVAVVQPC